MVGCVIYVYDGCYLVEFNFGYNGSENFEKGSCYGFFFLFVVGYFIFNEKFFELLIKVIFNLKICVLYGLVGNVDIGFNCFFYFIKVDLGGVGFVFGD